MNGRAVAARLGHVGIWTNLLERLPIAGARDILAEIERLGYGTLWFPESVGSKEVFAHSALLLERGSRIAIAPGIANINARDPVAMANGARALAEAHPNRFILGLGVSHLPSVTQRGGRYTRPLETMSAYLDAMDSAPTTLRGTDLPPRLLAALGPRMLELAGQKSDGAHPYFVPVEHTRIARQVLGPQPCLAVEVACVLESDAATARAVARTYTARYLGLANYRNNLIRLGWSEEDLAGEGSDAIVDAVVAWGTPEQIAERVTAHHEAGADHVCVQLLQAEWLTPPLAGYAALAKVLL